jgi:hypothetical protein
MAFERLTIVSGLLPTPYRVQSPGRGQVIGCTLEDILDLSLGLVESIQSNECATEGDPRGQVRRIRCQPRKAHIDGFLILAGTPEFLAELSESDRRRILLKPASKTF